ncbi:MAG: ABC transporter ATP-binding protein [Pseudomonadota bacterium]
MNASGASAPGAVALRVDAACKQFGETAALAGASLELESGECVGLLGPNGAGKSTLARAIAGRVRPDSGDIAVFGRSLWPRRAPEALKAVSLVPQEIAFYGALSAAENLQCFGRLNGLHGARLTEQVRWALQWTGLDSRADEPATNFSGGMKRRLNLACGVLHEPNIVILDEPTEGVDPQSRAHLWEMLQGLRERGTALLLTTHQLDEAEQQCGRIVIIDSGRTIASGTTAELVEQTLGATRRLSIRVRTVPESLPEGIAVTSANVLETNVADPAADAASVLQSLHRLGATVEDVRLSGATLNDVFLELTGRALRDA